MRNFEVTIDETPVAHAPFVRLDVGRVSLMLHVKDGSVAETKRLANVLNDSIDHISFTISESARAFTNGDDVA